MTIVCCLATYGKLFVLYENKLWNGTERNATECNATEWDAL
jgi:hypothetical protein